MERKRLRGPNFTNSESRLLNELISKHKEVIESKRTDSVNLLKKQKAWIEIEKEFNLTTTEYARTLESLQQNYKNLKKRLKKRASSANIDIPVDKVTLIKNIEEYITSNDGWEKVASSTGTSADICKNIFSALKQADTREKAFKKNIMCTEGGKPLKSENDPQLDKVNALVGPGIDGIYTIYGDNSNSMATQKDEITIESKNTETSSICYEDHDASSGPSEVSEPEEEEDKFDLFANDNFKKNTHQLYRKRKSESQIPVHHTVADNFKTLTKEKMQLVMLQTEVLKIQLQEEKEKHIHNKILRMLELDDAKKKYKHNELLRRIQLKNRRQIHK